MLSRRVAIFDEHFRRMTVELRVGFRGARVGAEKGGY